MRNLDDGKWLRAASMLGWAQLALRKLVRIWQVGNGAEEHDALWRRIVYGRKDMGNRFGTHPVAISRPWKSRGARMYSAMPLFTLQIWIWTHEKPVLRPLKYYALSR